MNLEVIFFWLKILGIFLVVTGCIGMGFYKSREITERINALKEMQRLLLMIKNEIDYMARPLAEALGKASLYCKSVYKEFFEALEDRLYEKKGASFLEIWNDCVFEFLSDTAMCTSDLELICNIGENLEFTNKETQVSALELCMENMGALITHLEASAESKQRVYKCLGGFLGLLIVILLI